MIGIRVCVVILPFFLCFPFPPARDWTVGAERVHANMFMCFPEIFLPSYTDYHFDDLERRQDPVQDIILTEEEIKNMFPS